MVLELLSSNDTTVKKYIDSKNDHIISEGFLKNWDKNGKIDSVVVGTDYDSRKMRPYGKDTSLFTMDYFDFENNDIFNRSKRRYLENKILPVINEVSKKRIKSIIMI